MNALTVLVLQVRTLLTAQEWNRLTFTYQMMLLQDVKLNYLKRKTHR